MSEYLEDPDFLALMDENMSPSTLRTYSFTYRNLMEAFQINSLYDLFNDNSIDEVENFLLAHNPNTALMYLKVIKKLFDKDDVPEDLIKIEDNLRQDRQKAKIENNDILKAKLQKYKTMLDKLKKIDDPLKYIVNYLILFLNVRNSDFILEIVYDRKDMYDKSKNYIYMCNTKAFFVRNIYKTAKTYGVKENAISNKRFRKAILEFSNGMNTKLFTDKKGNMIVASNHLGAIIPKYTINNYTESEIFKIVVRDIDEKGNLNRLKALSNRRGTSIETIVNEYHLNLNKFK